MMLIHLSPLPCDAIPHWHKAIITEDARSTDACWIAEGGKVHVVFWSAGKPYTFEVPKDDFKVEVSGK